MQSLVLMTHISATDAATPQDAANRAMARLFHTTFLASPFAIEPLVGAVYGALASADGFAWVTGVIHEPWEAPRIAPWALTSERSRPGLPTLPSGIMPSNTWRIEARVPLPKQTFATVDAHRDALGEAFANWRSSPTRPISVHTQNARWDCVGRLSNDHMVDEMLACRTHAGPCASALRGSLLSGLCRRYDTPNVFGWEQIARICAALKHREDRILRTRDLELVLWNALPRPLTDAVLTAFALPLDTPLRVDDRSVHPSGYAVPSVLTSCFSALSYALTNAYVPHCGMFGSATFAQAEADNYFRLAEGLATHPNQFVEAVCEAWESLGIDLNPPSTHRMEGLMP